MVNITEQQYIQIRWMLQEIDGGEMVKNMDSEKTGQWVFELKKGRSGSDELMTIRRSLIKRTQKNINSSPLGMIPHTKTIVIESYRVGSFFVLHISNLTH